jgi:hypothetical protein
MDIKLISYDLNSGKLFELFQIIKIQKNSKLSYFLSKVITSHFWVAELCRYIYFCYHRKAKIFA